MKKIIALEEFALFLLAIYAFSQLTYAWWVFPALLLLPDLSMLGYLAGTKAGAICYNVVHHKALGIVIYFLGMHYSSELLVLTGVILFAHSCFDRILGYGLKYDDSFQHTHLGYIGKNRDGQGKSSQKL
jgi:hypothetical protein